MSEQQNEQQNDPDAGRASDEEVQGAQDAISENAGGDPNAETNPDSPHFTAPTNDDLGQSQVQERMNEATEQGFIGAQVDPTPHENYSLQTPQDAPTPETDPDLQAQADAAIRGNRLLNVTTPTHQTEDQT